MYTNKYTYTHVNKQHLAPPNSILLLLCSQRQPLYKYFLQYLFIWRCGSIAKTMLPVYCIVIVTIPVLLQLLTGTSGTYYMWVWVFMFFLCIGQDFSINTFMCSPTLAISLIVCLLLAHSIVKAHLKIAKSNWISKFGTISNRFGLLNLYASLCAQSAWF